MITHFWRLGRPSFRTYFVQRMTLKNDENFKRILSPPVMDLHRLFESNGFELRIAGGAPRDLLLSILPNDLDFATTATPQEMVDLFTQNDIRMINDNGYERAFRL